MYASPRAQYRYRTVPQSNSELNTVLYDALSTRGTDAVRGKMLKGLHNPRKAKLSTHGMDIICIYWIWNGCSSRIMALRLHLPIGSRSFDKSCFSAIFVILLSAMLWGQTQENYRYHGCHNFNDSKFFTRAFFQ